MITLLCHRVDEPQGEQYLVDVHPDGLVRYSTRPCPDRSIAWSAPTTLCEPVQPPPPGPPTLTLLAGFGDDEVPDTPREGKVAQALRDFARSDNELGWDGALEVAGYADEIASFLAERGLV